MTNSYSIDISLAEDPNLHARAWRQKVKTMLGKAARATFEKGLNTFDVMLSKEEYALKHPSSPKRKTPKMPKPLTKTSKTYQIRLYDEKKAQYQAYVEAYDAAKEAIIASIGPDIRKAIEHPENGMEKISIGYICAYVAYLHGQVNDEDLAKVNAELETAWDPSTPLPTFIANMTYLFASLEAWGHAKSEHDKLVYLERALSTDPSAAEAIRATKVDAAKTRKSRTFADTTAEIIQVAPAMRPTTASAILAHARSVPQKKLPRHITIPSTGNPVMDAFLADHLNKNASSFAGASVTIAHKSAPITPPSATPPDNGACLYCFVHGWNFTHVGMDCDELNAKPETEIRNAKMEAKTPRTKVDGRYGSTYVARAPPRGGKGNTTRRSGGNKKKRGQAAAAEADTD